MRKLLLATIAASALAAGSAYAADLPLRGPAEAPAPIFVGVNWTGFYVGAHAGYGWGKHDRTTITNFRNSYNSNGGLAGVHVGYNWQFNSMVVGLEANGDWMGISGNDGGAGDTLDRTSLTYGGAIRARAGFLVTPTFLLYAAGGWAVANAEHFNNARLGQKIDRTVSGWTVGGGAEYKFAPNWSHALNIAIPITDAIRIPRRQTVFVRSVLKAAFKTFALA